MRISKPTKLVALIPLVLLSINGITVIRNSFQDDIYHKDFIHLYLAGHALRAGTSPYLPLPELAETFLGVDYQHLKHPSPYPPPALLLGLPLSFLPYKAAVLFWLVFECLCLFASFYLITGRWHLSALLVGASFAWWPVWEELANGQVMILILLCFTVAWRCLRSARDVAGGVALGIIFTLKFMGWPVLFYLLYKRRFRPVLAAAATTAALYAVSLLLVGIEAMPDYVTRVGPLVLSLNRHRAMNISAWSVGHRLFEGTLLSYFTAPPLIHAPALAPFVSFAAAVAVIVWAGRRAASATSFDGAYCVLLAAGILLSPIAWPHYLVLLFLPLTLRGLASVRDLLPLLLTAALIEFSPLVLLLLSVPNGDQMLVPSWAILLTYLPAIFTVQAVRQLRSGSQLTTAPPR